jgi:hypothetical protein
MPDIDLGPALIGAGFSSRGFQGLLALGKRRNLRRRMKRRSL